MYSTTVRYSLVVFDKKSKKSVLKWDYRNSTSRAVSYQKNDKIILL